MALDYNNLAVDMTDKPYPTPIKTPITNAIWHLQLLTRCPHCESDHDLLIDKEFLDVHGIDYGEVNTQWTKDVSIDCPSCEESFIINLE